MFPNIQELINQVAAFDRSLINLKPKVSVDFDWYPYNSLGTFYELLQSLAQAGATLPQFFDHATILDLCCGDGDVAYFFESIGCDVTAVDFPGTNFNQMRGVYELQTKLAAKLRIFEMNLDRQFAIPGTFDLAIFMGALYHVKNPFYVLEMLSHQARYAIVSTRVARFTPQHLLIQNEPLAYLLDSAESNNDATNFWIFSQAGLRRLLQRSGWHVSHFMTIGNAEVSDPATLTGDERAICLLRSRHCRSRSQLLTGWHALEANCWRWTERVFSASFPTHSTRPHLLRLSLTLPQSVLDRLGPITLTSSVTHLPDHASVYSSSGHHSYERILIPSTQDTIVTFELDKAISKGIFDDRELGIIVESVDLEEVL